jgi:hypothetical protein
MGGLKLVLAWGAVNEPMFGEMAKPSTDAAPRRGGPRASPEDENTHEACF